MVSLNYQRKRNQKAFRQDISFSGRQNCVDAYSKIAEALFQGGIDGFLLETMNYWDEALMALEGVELFFRKVKAAKNFCPRFCRKDLGRYPGFDPITFTFNEN